MARGSWTQSNFLGGEFSPAAGGRIDLPMYQQALAQCRNMYPLEEGAVTRRPGTMFIQPTYLGAAGAIYPWPYSQIYSYAVEFTADASDNIWARSYTNGHLVTENTTNYITAITTSTPAQITLHTAADWSTGDQIMIQLSYAGLASTETTMWSAIMNRQLTVTKINTTTFTLADMITNTAINGSAFTSTIPSNFVSKVTRTAVSAYSGTTSVIQSMQPIVAEQNLVLLNANFGVPLPPLTLVETEPASAGADLEFSVSTLAFTDGPYLTLDDGSGSPYSINATSGSATFTISNASLVNDGVGFVSTDVGRLIRIVQTITPWNSTTIYSTGNTVSYPPSAAATGYTALPSSTTNVAFEPDINPAYWAPIADAVLYNSLVITAVNSTSNVTVTIQGALPGNSTSNPIIQMAMGAYTYTDNQFPTAGTFFEGRLIFGLGSTIDGSVTNGYLGPSVLMSPTDGYGNVLDSSGFSFILNGPGVNACYWMHPDAASIIVGTVGSEWQIQASALGDPLTPTSFQAHQVTRIGSQYLLPMRPGIALVFVNRYSQRLIEYLADPFTSKYSGKPLNVNAQHMGPLGQIEYQDAPNPMIWSIGTAGSLLTCTYRRISYFASEMPTFYGWAKHTLGSGRSIINIANGYDSTGMYDQLYLLTTNGTNSFVEYVTPPFSDVSTLPQAQFVDSAMTGINYATSTQPVRFEGIFGVSDGSGNLYFNGLYYLAGQTVAVFFGGLDFGNYVVSATGVVGPVAYGSDVGGQGTLAYLKSVAVTLNTNGSIPCSLNEVGGGNYSIPGVIGFTYTSTVQRLRPDVAVDARTQDGPGSGKLKRHHWYSILPSASVTGTVNVSGGSSFDTAYPAEYYQNGVAVTTGVLFSGVHRDTIDSEDDLNGQMEISVIRPVPLTLASWTGFIETEEI